MKAKEIYEIVNKMKPNQYTDMLPVWLRDFEKQVYQKIILTHEDSELINYDPDAAITDDTELIIPEEFKNVYVFYLDASIDISNADYERYNNTIIMYNRFILEYRNWYNKNHMPLSQAKMHDL